MRILYLDHGTALGGAEFSLLDLLRTLDRARFQPALACPDGRLAARARALDMPLLPFEFEKLGGGRNPLSAFLGLRRGQRELRRAIGGEQFDVLHANTLRSALYAHGVARRLGARFVWHVRDYAMPAWVRRRLMQRCDIAVAPSQFIAATLGESSRIRVVPNGIDLAEVPPEAAAAFRREVGLAADAPVVGCLGRLLRWKGQHRFAEVAGRLAWRVPEARFLVVGSPLYAEGEGDYLGELKGAARKLGVESKLLFVPQRDDPLAALSAMDVVVNCSENEPFGRVLIEAMACRRPVVAFRSGAVPEIVEDGLTGLLVPPGQMPAMAGAVLDLLRDPERARAYGEAGRQRVASRFPLAATTRGIEAAYAELGEPPSARKA